jgi:hypothetical protein
MNPVSSIAAKGLWQFRETFSVSLNHHKTLKAVLLLSAGLYIAEFFISLFFYASTSTPFFLPPIPTETLSGQNFLYAHSIIRQYAFFVLELALATLVIAARPDTYRPFLFLLIFIELLSSAFAAFMGFHGHLVAAQWIPAAGFHISIAALLGIFMPKSVPILSTDAERNTLAPLHLFAMTLPPRLHYTILQLSAAIAGGLWILWGLGSTVFWELGVQNISSDKTAELRLIDAMRLNFIVRSEQGLMLIAIGLITLLTAWRPVRWRQMMAFILIQQVLNAISAAVELGFGTILFPQFLTVVGVQAFTFVLFYMLYPAPQLNAQHNALQQ